MADVSPGPGWWLASDGKFYPPHLHPNYRTNAPLTRPSSPPPGWWRASDGQWYPPQTHPSYAAKQAVSTAVLDAPQQAPPRRTSIPPQQPADDSRRRRSRQRRWSLTAIASFVIAFLCWPVGIFAGHWMLRKLRRTGQKGHGFVMVGLILSYIFGVLTVGEVVFAVVLSKPHGYNNATTLQSSVVQTTNAKLHSAPFAAEAGNLSATSAVCVDQSGTQWSCVVTMSDGRQGTLLVSVASDGTRWVTEGSGIAALLPSQASDTTSTPSTDNRDAQSNLTNSITSAKAIYAQTAGYPATGMMVRDMKHVDPKRTYTTGASSGAQVISVDVASATALYFAAWAPASRSCWLAMDTEGTSTAGVYYSGLTGKAPSTASQCTGALGTGVAASTWSTTFPTG